MLGCRNVALAGAEGRGRKRRLLAISKPLGDLLLEAAEKLLQPLLPLIARPALPHCNLPRLSLFLAHDRDHYLAEAV